ncbi:MAG: TlpA family protein disulfide reductase, partial [Candidatus Saccharimonadales bacterium]
RRWCFTFGVLLVGATLAWAADEAKKKPPAQNAPADSAAADDAADADAAEGDELSVAEQFQVIQTEMSKKQRDLGKRYRAAEDDADRQKVLEEFNKLRSEIIDKYVEIVQKHPDDDAVFPALQMLLGTPDHAAMATKVLLKHHLDNEQIGMLCLQLGQQGNPDAEKLLRAVAEKSTSHDAKGLALLGLGQMLSERSNSKDVDEKQRERLRKEAKEPLATVVSTSADVDAGRGKAGDLAAGVLFELEHLAVGLPAPDLEGNDLDGAAFKLSDYRGKVVFLDFWAHW